MEKTCIDLSLFVNFYQAMEIHIAVKLRFSSKVKTKRDISSNFMSFTKRAKDSIVQIHTKIVAQIFKIWLRSSQDLDPHFSIFDQEKIPRFANQTCLLKGRKIQM